MTIERRTSSPEETIALARALGRVLPAGAIVTLDGELGAGKTTFVRGLAQGLGIESGVASPTYTLMQEHRGGRLPLYHFDAYMEGREKALLAGGADEFLGGDGVAVIEWASRVSDWLPEPRIHIRLTHVAAEERGIEISMEGGSPGSSELLDAVQGAFEATRIDP